MCDMPCPPKKRVPCDDCVYQIKSRSQLELIGDFDFILATIQVKSITYIIEAIKAVI